MGAGGWNKGIKNSTGGGMTGHTHSVKTRKQQSISAKKSHRNPEPTKIKTNDICEYGCGEKANYVFLKGKKCCSKHYNSCPGKRKAFSERTDHKERNEKSLKTRLKLGITKTTSIKAQQTMRENGTFDIMSEKMKLKWAESPWNNNPNCPILKYKTIDLNYQGSYEFEFLEEIEEQYGIKWIEDNVSRGPNIWYDDPTTNTKRLYISDFLIDNTIYEIKSYWTWNKKGEDMILEQKNKAKLNACLSEGYDVILVINGEQINAPIMDGAIQTKNCG